MWFMQQRVSATPALVSSATRDASTAQEYMNKIKNKNLRMYHPLSPLTDGGLYYVCTRYNAGLSTPTATNIGTSWQKRKTKKLNG